MPPHSGVLGRRRKHERLQSATTETAVVDKPAEEDEHGHGDHHH
jgi:hypothetical protein